jgi:hypothetical protein
MDSPQFAIVVPEATEQVRFDRLLGDKGYDAEHNHRLAREKLGIPYTIIPVRIGIGRNRSRKWPTSKYRRQMRKCFWKRAYGQRWQVESVFSRHKRLLGANLRAATWPAQQREMLLRVATHNFMILAATVKLIFFTGLLHPLRGFATTRFSTKHGSF